MSDERCCTWYGCHNTGSVDTDAGKRCPRHAEPLMFRIMQPDTYQQRKAVAHLDCPESVPWAFMKPHDAQARNNHSQTLCRLGERGGLSPSEACAVLEDREWEPMTEEAAMKRLMALLHQWSASQGKPCANCKRIDCSLVKGWRSEAAYQSCLKATAAEAERWKRTVKHIEGGKDCVDWDAIGAALRAQDELREVRRVLDDEMLESLGREAIVKERSALLARLINSPPSPLTVAEIARCTTLEVSRLAIDCKAMQNDLDAVALALSAVACNRDSAVRYSTIDALAALLPHELAIETLKKLSEDEEAVPPIRNAAREALTKGSTESR